MAIEKQKSRAGGNEALPAMVLKGNKNGARQLAKGQPRYKDNLLGIRSISVNWLGEAAVAGFRHSRAPGMVLKSMKHKDCQKSETFAL
jgi:hypothetical protein